MGKLAFKDVAGGGATGLLFALAAVGSTVLMLHFLTLVRRATPSADRASISAAAWVGAVTAATVLQWSLFSAVTGVSAAYALKPGVIFELLLPVVVGALIAWALAATDRKRPQLPPGDISAHAAGFIERASPRLAGLATRLETEMRRWPVSSLALVVTLIVLVAMQALRVPG